jgi:hypothetical protein
MLLTPEKIFFTACLSLIMLSLHAQKINLNYEPHKPVIVFQQFNSENPGAKFITDTSSVFNMRQPYNDTLYAGRIKRLILREWKKSGKDSVYFKGAVVPFNDGFDIRQLKIYTGYYENGWAIQKAVVELMNSHHLKIAGASGKQVSVLKIKKSKIKKPVSTVFIEYSDKDTGEILFNELMYLETPIE